MLASSLLLWLATPPAPAQAPAAATPSTWGDQGLVSTTLQAGGARGGLPPGPSAEAPEYRVLLEPPGPERLFRLQSDARLREQMRQEYRHVAGVERILFPEEPPVTSECTPPRRLWPALREVVEPNYVCYGRTLFDQLNAERYGWELGLLQPFISTGVFYADVLLLPYHLASEPCRWYECNAGYCLPGDPVPYLLYPPTFSLTGLVGEAAAVGGVVAAFP
jgi:hypothetical protein